MLQQLEARAETLAPADGRPSDLGGLESAIRYMAETQGLHVKATLPLLRAMNNGGVPSKPAGRTVSLPIVGKIPVRTLASFGYRVVLLASVLFVVAEFRAASIEIGKDGVKITNKTARVGP
jgi:hypothetical protein